MLRRIYRRCAGDVLRCKMPVQPALGYSVLMSDQPHRSKGCAARMREYPAPCRMISVQPTLHQAVSAERCTERCCDGYDITKLTLINSALDDLITPKNKEEKPKQITHSVNDLLDRLIEESVKLVGKPVALMNKEDKVTAIQFLNDSGAFLITKSGDKVANYFGISKYTLYSYIDVNK